MANQLDINEICQINENIYKKQTEVFIPCLKTYNDTLGEKNEFTNSAEIFFEFAAFHKSKITQLKQRPDPVRVFRTSPIANILIDKANKEWEEKKSDRIKRAIELIFSATEPQIFDSVMHPQLSIFEKAIILKEECGELANITIISNDTKIKEHKKEAEKESGKVFSDKDFKIMTTNEWLSEQMFEKDNPEVRGMVVNVLLKEKEMQIGSRLLKLADSK